MVVLRRFGVDFPVIQLISAPGFAEENIKDGSRAVAEADGIKDGATHDATAAEAPLDMIGSAAETAGPQTVAQRLRTAREAAGLDIKAVAASTRIAPRHLEALERGDYASMAGRPYALGFARNYARALGLDAQAIANAVRGELDAQEPTPEPRVIHQFEVGDPAKTPSRLIGWLVALLLIGVVAMGLVFWRSYYFPAAGLPSLIGPEEAAPPPAAAALPPAGQRPAPAPSGPVVFTALEDGVWVKFYDGTGTQLMQKQMARDESFTVPARCAADHHRRAGSTAHCRQGRHREGCGGQRAGAAGTRRATGCSDARARYGHAVFADRIAARCQPPCPPESRNSGAGRRAFGHGSGRTGGDIDPGGLFHCKHVAPARQAGVAAAII
jgi:transcriptional regulator with XRE-family HTH domain